MSSRQAPIGSGLGPKSTAEEALGGRDLSGVEIIVTGGYAGLGLETARVLGNAGANVVVPARDEVKARKAVEGLKGITLASLDLTVPASIDAFADSHLATGRPLHILINNAGVMASPLLRDGRGHEGQFSTNHLGHFQLTARLWPALRRAGSARVVNVSSRGHRLAPVDFEDPDFLRRPYDKWVAYGQSKTANILFALGLDRRAEALGIRAFSLHPGGILTDLARHLDAADLRRVGATDEAGNFLPPEKNGFKTVEQGAATQVWCATSPQLDGMGGVYCEDCEVAEVGSDGDDRHGVRPWAVDPEAADRLWRLSEQMVGREFQVT
ncbi:oxidoreductase [Chondromyces crocatus]|uniref:Probable oxidoreductase n=1 Tax=Chondromyces crocatus TaxID=52 RepID=A0A0K1ER42_CHOCO|nr:oxidoreductase [Chondromyces crocatus]AKT43068.1 oxidoreductase [Chondromyces crocatus]